jgi:hypothetical protein
MTNVEELLCDALHEAHTDPRFALPPAPDALRRVRRRAHARRARTAALAAAGIAVVGAGGGYAATQLGGSTTTHLQYAGGGPTDGSGSSTGSTTSPSPSLPPLPSPSPVPGISPAWTPTRGADWLMSRAEYTKFASTHTAPRAVPRTITSPATLKAAVAQLAADARTALPEGTKLVPNHPVADDVFPGLDGTLPDGTSVEADWMQLQTPFTYKVEEFGPGTTAPRSLPTGSAYVAEAHGGDLGGPAVKVVTPTGEQTVWSVPPSGSLDKLVRWAIAADAFQRAHPNAAAPAPTR